MKKVCSYKYELGMRRLLLIAPPRNRFIQLWVRSITHLRARNPASSRIARASSPLERICAVKLNFCTTARTS